MLAQKKQGSSKHGSCHNSGSVRCLKFLVGIVIFAGFFSFFASGYSPPGICGEVLRHNQVNDIDASPLLYSEVEHMSDLEEGVRKMRERAKTQHDAR